MRVTAMSLVFLPLDLATGFPFKEVVRANSRPDAGVAGLGLILGRMDFPHFLPLPIGRIPACRWLTFP
jgi:hypothetical protein